MMNKVLYNLDQRNDTTDAQKTTARNNIGAVSSSDVSSAISNAIGALDVTDTAVANKFVTAVSEADGKIAVSRDQPAIADVSGLQDALDSIPRPKNGVLTIQKNGTQVTTFSADQSSNATANITVPTKTSELTNDSGFITETEVDTKLAGKANASHTHDDRYYTETEVDTKLGGKVDKVSGKGLSTNDFTAAYKDNVDSNTSARHTHSNKSVLDGISSSDVANWNTHSVVGVEADSTTAFDANTPVVVGYNGTSKKLKTRLASGLWNWIKSQISSVLGLSENSSVLTYSGTAAEASHANNANYSAWAVGIGSPSGPSPAGGSSNPIYIDSNGIPTPCGFNIVLNSLSSEANTLYFF